jgi:hypothetical protein
MPFAPAPKVYSTAIHEMRSVHGNINQGTKTLLLSEGLCSSA